MSLSVRVTRCPPLWTRRHWRTTRRLESIALVVGDELDTVVLPNGDAAGSRAEVDADSF